MYVEKIFAEVSNECILHKDNLVGWPLAAEARGRGFNSSLHRLMQYVLYFSYLYFGPFGHVSVFVLSSLSLSSFCRSITTLT